MNPEVKKMWIEALRSGEYKQVKRHLHTKDGFCCLGVLCDISKLGKWKGAAETSEVFCYKSVEDHYSFLPLDVMKWADLDDSAPFVWHDGEQRNLSGLNDEGVSFEEIAGFSY